MVLTREIEVRQIASERVRERERKREREREREEEREREKERERERERKRERERLFLSIQAVRIMLSPFRPFPSQNDLIKNEVRNAFFSFSTRNSKK